MKTVEIEDEGDKYLINLNEITFITSGGIGETWIYFRSGKKLTLSKTYETTKQLLGL